MRFKNRYLLFQLEHDQNSSLNLTGGRLLHLIRESVEDNFGDFGVGKVRKRRQKYAIKRFPPRFWSHWVSWTTMLSLAIFFWKYLETITEWYGKVRASNRARKCMCKFSNSQMFSPSLRCGCPLRQSQTYRMYLYGSNVRKNRVRFFAKLRLRNSWGFAWFLVCLCVCVCVYQEMSGRACFKDVKGNGETPTFAWCSEVWTYKIPHHFAQHEVFSLQATTSTAAGNHAHKHLPLMELSLSLLAHIHPYSIYNCHARTGPAPWLVL